VAAREQAEAAIADVLSRRIAVEKRLAQACDGAGDAGQEHRKRVTAARDELAHKGHQLPAKLNPSGSAPDGCRCSRRAD
jgi:hypothetical protein